MAIKKLSWAIVHRLRERHMEDSLKEAACLQLIGNDHPNVLGCRVVLQDKDYLYVIIPYCGHDDLCETVTHRAGGEGLDEPEARYWFRQILQECVYACFLQDKKDVQMAAYLQIMPLSLNAICISLETAIKFMLVSLGDQIGVTSFAIKGDLPSWFITRKYLR